MMSSEKKFSWKEIVLGILGVGGAVGIGVGIHCHYQNRKLMKIFGKAVNEVSELTTVDVSNAIIDEAVKQAAGREVGKAVQRATRAMEGEIAETARKKVAGAVQENYKKISQTVTDRIAKEAASINMERISEDVVEKATQLISDKFDSKLDDLTEAYSKQIKSVGKVYESFAEKLSGEKGKTISLNL